MNPNSTRYRALLAEAADEGEAMRQAWIRRLQCASCEAFSFKVVEDGEVWLIECNHCGALVAAAEDQAGKKTHANGAWVKERVL